MVIYVERYLLSRSTIVDTSTFFLFDLTRADVIQLESEPCEARKGLLWCPYSSLAAAHVEINENKHVSFQIIYLTLISGGTCIT